ncbi:helix-turn-helix transcriptional regulator [Streptococcus hyointestinalis]|nr:helix-turn-helix transcriptional regulator [Streptococcus hyointestinalis]
MQKLSLKMARVQAGLTQEEIAKKMGTNRVTYADYENYTTIMRMDKAVLFSKIVQVPLDEIIFLKKNYT